MIPFRAYDALRLFVIVSRYPSFTAAGADLNLTKGAVSYQIKQLEKACGYKLFHRLHNRIALTDKGQRLVFVAQLAFEDIEQELTNLRQSDTMSITIGASTYFASRWLASRLMTFISAYPKIRLRLQPVMGWGDLRNEQLDLMVRWGKANWQEPDNITERLLRCPSIVTAGWPIAEQVAVDGIASVIRSVTLLHDHEDSSAWQDWFTAASIPYRPKHNPLVIPDPNVRVEAVVNGQGVALNDELIRGEVESGRLFQISPIELADYGYYLVYPKGALRNPALLAFRDWIMGEVNE